MYHNFDESQDGWLKTSSTLCHNHIKAADALCSLNATSYQFISGSLFYISLVQFILQGGNPWCASNSTLCSVSPWR